MAEWYYFQGGNQQGPVSDDQVRSMVSSGQLSPSDSVWRNGMANWAPISSIPELMPASSGRSSRREDDYDDRGRGGYDDDYRAPRSSSGGGVKAFTIWSIIMVVGGGLWLINGLLPWYSNPFGPGVALGLRVTAGLIAFIMSFLLLGFVITSWFVPILAEWRWTGAFFFAVMGLVEVILGFFVFQGIINSIGVFIHLPASLAVLTGSVLEGIFGLMAFLARTKGNR